MAGTAQVIGGSILGLLNPPDEALALFDRVDQASLRQDLAAFFGPDGEAYLDTYEKMRASTRRNHAVLAWSWPVFFLFFAWFFYRKQYALGVVLLVVPLALAVVLGSGSSALAIVAATVAKPNYVGSALTRIAKADALGLSGAERFDYLQRAGGVSDVAGILSGSVYALMLALAFAQVASGP